MGDNSLRHRALLLLPLSSSLHFFNLMPFSKATFEITSAPSPENTCNWKLVSYEWGIIIQKSVLIEVMERNAYMSFITLCVQV